MIDKRSRIINSFLELLATQPNVHEISVRMIAEQAKIGKGTVYEYFSSKEEIVRESMFQIVDLIMDLFLVDNYGDLLYEDALKQYIKNNIEAAKQFNHMSQYTPYNLGDAFQIPEIKEIMMKKVQAFSRKAETLFEKRVVDPGISQGIIQKADPLTIQVLIKMIGHSVMEYCDVETSKLDKLETKLFEMIHLQLTHMK